MTSPFHRESTTERALRDLETIVMKAIAKEAAERYSTAGELASDLENFLADRPILGAARQSGGAAWRWCRRNPAERDCSRPSVSRQMAMVGVAVGLIFHTQLRTAYAEVDRQRTIAEGALASERRFLYYNRVTIAKHR